MSAVPMGETSKWRIVNYSIPFSQLENMFTEMSGVCDGNCRTQSLQTAGWGYLGEKVMRSAMACLN